MTEENGMVVYLFSHKPILIERMKGKLYEFNRNPRNFTIEYYFEPDADKFTKSHPLKASFHKTIVAGQEVIAIRI